MGGGGCCLFGWFVGWVWVCVCLFWLLFFFYCVCVFVVVVVVHLYCSAQLSMFNMFDKRYRNKLLLL